MRNVDYDLADSFAKWERRVKWNSEVLVENNSVFLTLHWNIIAARPEDSLKDLTFHLPIKYQTVTTKNRLNAILLEMGFPVEIKAFKTVWFFVNKIDGSKTEVQPGPNFLHL